MHDRVSTSRPRATFDAGDPDDSGRHWALDDLFFLRALWKRRSLIGLCVLGSLLLGGAYLAVAQKKYEAKAEILIDPGLGRIVGPNPTQPSFVTEVATIDSQIELLSSLAVMKRLAKTAHLSEDPEFNGSRTGLLASILGTPRDLVDGVDMRALTDAFLVKRRDRTFVGEIHAFASDPNKAADLANGLAEAYTTEQTESRVAAASKHADWLNERLTSLQKQIYAAEGKVEAFKTRNHVVTSEGLRSNESQIMDATHELGLARARASEAQARFDQVQKAARSGRVEAISDALKSQTIEMLRVQQAAADREVARLATTLSGRHPALLEAQAQANRQRALLSEELRRIQASAKNDYESARLQEKRMERTVEQLKAQSNVASQANLELRQLERDVEVLKGSYDNYAKTRDGLVERQSTAPPAQVIASAYPPHTPARPRVWLVLAAALGHGLVIGALLALFLERRANS